MGNRANVIFTDNNEKNISCNVYLHWNGGAESIYAFLNELDRRNIRSDQDYECARFIKLVGDYFDQHLIGGYSLGVMNGPSEITCEALNKIQTDSSDNGFYIVCREDKKTTMRRFVVDYNNKDINDDYPLKELSKKEVKAERKKAMTSNYITDIAESFKKIQGDREIDNT